MRAAEVLQLKAIAPDGLLTQWFEEHRRFLWGLCYRITGSAADADDVVQETFMKAIAHAPSKLEAPRPWLVRVAVNAARDLLRRRKRRAYVGQWLPTPIDTAEEDAQPSYEPLIDGAQTSEGRYNLMESVSLAFLQALEALTPTQRAVLLLRDVFDYSASEVSKALGISAGHARIVHHRARKAMAAYDGQRAVPTASSRERTQEALHDFLKLPTAGDVRGIERMLARDIVALTDGGGQFTATRHPSTGPARVARLFTRLAASRPGSIAVAFRMLNGFPAVVFDFEPSTRGRRAPRLVLTADVNAAGQIHRLRAITNPFKLAAVSRAVSAPARSDPTNARGLAVRASSVGHRRSGHQSLQLEHCNVLAPARVSTPGGGNGTFWKSHHVDHHDGAWGGDVDLGDHEAHRRGAPSRHVHAGRIAALVSDARRDIRACRRHPSPRAEDHAGWQSHSRHDHDRRTLGARGSGRVGQSRAGDRPAHCIPPGVPEQSNTRRAAIGRRVMTTLTHRTPPARLAWLRSKEAQR